MNKIGNVKTQLVVASGEHRSSVEEAKSIYDGVESLTFFDVPEESHHHLLYHRIQGKHVGVFTRSSCNYDFVGDAEQCRLTDDFFAVILERKLRDAIIGVIANKEYVTEKIVEPTLEREDPNGYVCGTTTLSAKAFRRMLLNIDGISFKDMYELLELYDMPKFLQDYFGIFKFFLTGSILFNHFSTKSDIDLYAVTRHESPSYHILYRMFGAGGFRFRSNFFKREVEIKVRSVAEAVLVFDKGMSHGPGSPSVNWRKYIKPVGSDIFAHRMDYIDKCNEAFGFMNMTFLSPCVGVRYADHTSSHSMQEILYHFSPLIVEAVHKGIITKLPFSEFNSVFYYCRQLGIAVGELTSSIAVSIYTAYVSLASCIEFFCPNHNDHSGPQYFCKQVGSTFVVCARKATLITFKDGREVREKLDLKPNYNHKVRWNVGTSTVDLRSGTPKFGLVEFEVNGKTYHSIVFLFSTWAMDMSEFLYSKDYATTIVSFVRNLLSGDYNHEFSSYLKLGDDH
jgi:hypothetical protein